MDTERRGKLRWKHILTLAGIGVLVPVLALGYHYGRDAYDKQQQAEREARYDDGLEPCGEMDNIYMEFRRRLGVPADFMVAIYPAFEAPDLIAVSRNEVHLLAFRRSDREQGTGWPAPSNHLSRKISLPPDLISEVVQTVSGDMDNARAKPVYGLDGVSYVFFDKAGRCAETWSPQAGTRAHKLTSLAYALREAARSPEGPEREAATERVSAALAALQD